MSAAQEEEIRQLHEQLAAAQAEKAAEAARASALQVALFEAGMKARQAMDACKRDAVEVAVEEAVRQHYVAMAEMEEMVNRSVGQISHDKALLLNLRGSLLALRSRAKSFAATLGVGDHEAPQKTGADLEVQAEMQRRTDALKEFVRRRCSESGNGELPEGEQVEGGVIDAATSSSERSGNGEAQTAEMVHAAIDLAALACAAMGSPDMALFLDDDSRDNGDRDGENMESEGGENAAGAAEISAGGEAASTEGGGDDVQENGDTAARIRGPPGKGEEKMVGADDGGENPPTAAEVSRGDFLDSTSV
jgi:hypothetical protein